MIVQKFVMGFVQTNSYILGDEEEGTAIVIDVPDHPEPILSFLKEKKLTLKAILLTHGHCDHVLGVLALKVATGAQVYLHEADQSMVLDPVVNLSTKFPMEPVSFKADHLLKGGEHLSFGPRLNFDVLHTPGHTPGSVCYHIKDKVYTGDTIFFQSIGRTDFYGGSLPALVEGVRTKIFVLPDETRLYPGHGEKTTVKHEKRFNPYLR